MQLSCLSSFHVSVLAGPLCLRSACHVAKRVSAYAAEAFLMKVTNQAKTQISCKISSQCRQDLDKHERTEGKTVVL